MNLNFLKRGNITVNGRSYSGKNVVVNNGVVIVDGVEQEESLKGIVNIVVNGDVESIQKANNVTVNGNCDRVETVSGDINCQDVYGDVKSVSGDINAKGIAGSVRTVSGDIRGVK